MRIWILLAVEALAAIPLSLTGYGDVALGLACGGTLGITVFCWPGSDD